jgi:hypothetical protein
VPFFDGCDARANPSTAMDRWKGGSFPDEGRPKRSEKEQREVNFPFLSLFNFKIIDSCQVVQEPVIEY